MAAAKKLKSRSKLPRGPDGKILAGPGRPKGIPNKVTGEAKHAIALAFEGIGGTPALIAWAKKTATNRMIFYTQLYTKLIPVTVAGKVDLDVNNGADAAINALERVLVSLIASQEQEESEGNAPIIIDAEPNREPVPQLVISSSKRTKAA